MRTLLTALLFTAVSALVGLAVPFDRLSGTALAQDEEESSAASGPTKRTPTMREQVYTKLSEAQQFAEANDFNEALKSLQDVEKIRNLTPYEIAQLHNFYAFIHYSREDYQGAIRSYETVLAQPDLPEAIETGTMYSLAQLYSVTEQYKKAEQMLMRWFERVTNPQPSAYVFLAQARYQLNDYRGALEPVRKAIELKESAGEIADESWYGLLRYLYYELEDLPAATKVLEKMVQIYPKKDYWLQLSGIYGQQDMTEKQMQSLNLAYVNGYLSRGPEFLNLAQLLMQANIPYRASKVLEDGFKQKAIERNANNLRLLSQAYILAQEDLKALDPLREAARLSEDGDLYIHLANSLLNLERYQESADAAEEALRKGIERPAEAHVVLGMALFNLDKLSAARAAFMKAVNDSKNGRMARQWVGYIEKEQERKQQLAAAGL